jgi:hypothetical protein
MLDPYLVDWGWGFAGDWVTIGVRPSIIPTNLQ